MFKHIIEKLLNELKTKGSFLLPLRLFIGLGWFRAGLSKLTKPTWYNGDALQKFLMDHLEKGDVIFPPYEFLVNNVFLPNVATFAWIVIIGQVLVGVSILSGTLTNLALMMGLIMNLNFILAGAPNPSAFYVVIQVVLLLSNTGAILGFDKMLSHKIHYAFLIAQPEHKTIRPLVERKFYLGLVLITLLSAIYSVFYIKEFNPNSVHDQAMILFVLAIISSAAFFIKYCYLIQHRIKFLVVDDESDAQDVMEDFIYENFEIEIVKVGTISEAQEKLVKDPNIVLIIADYNMPKSEENLDGGDLYLFNKGHKGLPFLLFSAEKVEDHQKLDNFYNDNIHNHIIGKPFDKKTTKECIENIVVFYMV